jgi:hypothetical protein
MLLLHKEDYCTVAQLYTGELDKERAEERVESRKKNPNVDPEHSISQQISVLNTVFSHEWRLHKDTLSISAKEGDKGYKCSGTASVCLILSDYVCSDNHINPDT